MSTFDGHVKEFPCIRIDYFRPSRVDESAPLAYFLSHVHSDHLTGLESRGGPFIYCSPATRDILLRLEKYPHRMNFAKGILESRKQTYAHLSRRLKAIPLETSTEVELCPGSKIRVTLFDANHCVGAVGFLIEGLEGEDQGKAVFYSGDVRSEAWWVERLARHPLIVPFTAVAGKGRRRLDCVYLDTTFASKEGEGRYRNFPGKAEGIGELVEKVMQYPPDTIFYYDAWTFGYEEVWQTLSSVLHTKIHVDDYRFGLYRALTNGVEPRAPEATKMVGYWCGNHIQEGCLTDRQTRLHSCEKGTRCPVWDQDFICITPIISRHDGIEMAELGAGGGKGDLNPRHELEFGGDLEMITKMLQVLGGNADGSEAPTMSLLKALQKLAAGGVDALQLDVPALGLDDSGDLRLDCEDMLDKLPLDKMLPALAQSMAKKSSNTIPLEREVKVLPPTPAPTTSPELPKRITFPYSRHSSYSELCLLIAALQPKDIHPCTVECRNWVDEASMEALFGDLYPEGMEVDFSHDRLMREKLRIGEQVEEVWRPYRDAKRKRQEEEAAREDGDETEDERDDDMHPSSPPSVAKVPKLAPDSSTVIVLDDDAAEPPRRQEANMDSNDRQRVDLTGEDLVLARRQEAYAAALSTGGRRWDEVGLVSVNGHQEHEAEL